MSAESYTEKVSVNVNVSTLSTIDLLVDNGYYSNRSDFINQAVRSELQRQQSVTDGILRRREFSEKSWFLCIYGMTARDVLELHRAGESVDVRGYGLLVIHEGCDEQKLFEVVRSVSVRGRVRASRAVKAHYGV